MVSVIINRIHIHEHCNTEDNRACLLGVSHRLILSQAKVKEDRRGEPKEDAFEYRECEGIYTY